MFLMKFPNCPEQLFSRRIGDSCFSTVSFIMEITTKGMRMIKSNDFTNHHTRQPVDFLKKHPCILFIKQTPLNLNFKGLQSNRTKSICVVALKFSKYGKYVTTKRSFKQFYIIMELWHKQCFA